jgi:biopolymer transport protein ExbB
MFLTILQAAQTTTATNAVAQSTSLMDIFLKMGAFGIVVCLIIFILSMVAIFVFIERYISVNNATKISANFMDKIRESITHGNLEAAKDLCMRNSSPISKVIGKGLSRLGQPLRDIQTAMESAGAIEVFELEKRLSTLSMISKLAPMFGFIGTIAGVIKIFYDISTTGDYNIEVISGGLYNKMITSLLGLGLGILSYAFYYVINTKIDRVMHKIEKSSLEFMDIISAPSK